MSVWLTIPSARPAEEIKERLERWRDMGYRIALWRNGPHVEDPIAADHLIRTAEYHGWGASINTLVSEVMVIDTHADWFVGGGDDTDPDPSKLAEEIALDCREEFGLRNQAAIVNGTMPVKLGLSQWQYWTFAVMQPTGDRFGADEVWAQSRFPNEPAYIDRICGSPWLGTEFCRRAHGGVGPFHPEFFHMFADEALQEYAKMLGVLWQRRDLIHFHDHCRRDGVQRTPDFAAATGIYDRPEWDKGQALLNWLKSEKFASCLPCR